MSDALDDLDDELGDLEHDNSTNAPKNAAGDQILAFVQLIERMEEEKKAILDDIKEIYAEAKGNGFDTKILRKVIRIRKQDKADRDEETALTELYLHAIGME